MMTGGQENQMSRVYCSLYQCLWTGTTDVHCVKHEKRCKMEREEIYVLKT